MRIMCAHVSSSADNTVAAQLPILSREAAPECSPRRKPWVPMQGESASSVGAKESTADASQGNGWWTNRNLETFCSLINQILFPHFPKLLQLILPILRNPPRILPRHQRLVHRLVHEQLLDLLHF